MSEKKKKNALPGVIRELRLLKTGRTVKLVFRVKVSSFRAELQTPFASRKDAFNDAEPYDRKTHVFYLPESEALNSRSVLLKMRLFSDRGPSVCLPVRLKGLPFCDEAALKDEYDNRLTLKESETESVCEGVRNTRSLYENKHGAPVRVFTTEFDPKSACLYIGTPRDGYRSVGIRATIPEMVASAEQNGINAVAAVNADFFDMFGDGHPSGLCVKNGKVIANLTSSRPFIALTRDGRHIITSLTESPGILNELTQAAAGLQLILKDGELFDYAPLEPFSFTCHPRTCVGIKPDGSVLLTVVDGRIPSYSNGASLVDLALLMKSFGADRALNMDGGGSSAMYTKKDGRLVLHSRPADLVRPNAALIRKDFNSLIVRKK